MHEAFEKFIRTYLSLPEGAIPLHRAVSGHEELAQLTDCLVSGQLSSVGDKVETFETTIAREQNVSFAIATQSGTSALHLALLGSGLQAGDLVITQPFTYVASCNAIRYCGADPLFVDVERSSLGLCPDALLGFLEQETEFRHNTCFHKLTQRKISHCVPVCSFGHPPKLDLIEKICQHYSIRMVVDGAEAQGSSYRNRAVGTYGLATVLSFNGNKIVTCGGGGMLLTNNQQMAERVRHLSQQAKVAEPQHGFFHDAIGYNYRMPALNAALGLGQLSRLSQKKEAMRQLAHRFESFFSNYGLAVQQEPDAACSNYWQQCLLFPKEQERDAFVADMQSRKIDCRPAWTLMTHLPMYRDCHATGTPHARWAERHLALLPSLAPSPNW